MARINPVKVKQDADKLEKAGRLDQAIAMYKQVIEDNPRDWNVINKVGDLYAKLNKFRDASEQYAKVADFYAKDGFHLKAIAIWKKINKLDASALEPYLNLAELYGKQGLMMEAKSQYQYVVDEYIKRGKTRDAGDVLKRMADIDPGDLKIRSKLADLYTREGNSAKAVEEHIAIADELNKKGHLAEAVQVLDKGLKIDPKSARLRVHIARVHLVQKSYEKAVYYLEEAVHQAPNDPEVLAPLGEAYLGAKRIEESETIFKRLLELNPQDDESRAQMSRVYLHKGQYDRSYEELLPVVDQLLERRDGERAATLLQAIIQKNAAHVKTLLKLVEIYRQLQKDSAVSAAYSQLTEAYLQAGQLEQAAAVLETLVARDPQNQQHKTKLEFVKGKLGGRPAAAAPAASPASEAPVFSDLMEEEFDLSVSDEAPAFDLGLEAPAAPAPPATRASPPQPAAPAPTTVPEVVARPTIEISGPLSDEDKEFIEEHLAEGRVFRKYGLVDKAADQFDSVIARFPDHVEARQELRDVFKEKGLADQAAEQCLALAEIFRLKGDETSALAQEAEAQRLSPAAAPLAPAPAKPEEEPAAPEVPAPSAAAPAPEPEALEPEAAAPFLETEEEEIQFGVGEEEPSLTEEEISLEVEEGGLEPPSEAAPVLAEEAEFDLGPEVGGEGELPSPFLDEEMDVPLPVEASAAEEEAISLESEASIPTEPAGLVEEEPLQFEEQEEAVAPVHKPAPAPPPAVHVPPPLAAKAPPAPPALDMPADLARVLDEVDSYISLGFVDDAKEALSEVSARYPSHPALLEKIAELGLEEAVVEAPVPEEPVPEELVLEAPAAGEEAVADALSEFDLGAEVPLETDFAPEVEESEIAPAPALLGDQEEALSTESLLGEAEAEAEDLISVPAASGLEMEGLDLDEPLPPALEPESPVLEAPDAGGIDLGDELGELFGAHSAVAEAAPESTSTDLGDAGLADIFKEFKKGVDKQLGKEDYDTRYNLGIAYKEMGLIDEAIAEFQLAAKDEGRILECSSMLGICFMEKGMPKLAIKWFEKGLRAAGRSEEEYSALRYDLAMAHEAAGDVDTALSLFTDLYGQDANFRDVAAKVRELRGAAG